MGTICENKLDKLKEYVWKIKVLKSQEDEIMVGVAPMEFDINSSLYDDCGWYYYICNDTLYSGPPDYYNNKKYSAQNEENLEEEGNNKKSKVFKGRVKKNDKNYKEKDELDDYQFMKKGDVNKKVRKRHNSKFDSDSDSEIRKENPKKRKTQPKGKNEFQNIKDSDSDSNFNEKREKNNKRKRKRF